MVDILDDSFENNSMNLSLKENDRIHPVLKEKETYEKTNKLLEYEFILFIYLNLSSLIF